MFLLYAIFYFKLQSASEVLPIGRLSDLQMHYFTKTSHCFTVIAGLTGPKACSTVDRNSTKSWKNISNNQATSTPSQSSADAESWRLCGESFFEEKASLPAPSSLGSKKKLQPLELSRRKSFTDPINSPCGLNPQQNKANVSRPVQHCSSTEKATENALADLCDLLGDSDDEWASVPALEAASSTGPTGSSVNTPTPRGSQSWNTKSATSGVRCQSSSINSVTTGSSSTATASAMNRSFGSPSKPNLIPNNGADRKYTVL